VIRYMITRAHRSKPGIGVSTLVDHPRNLKAISLPISFTYARLSSQP
jgi:hypothetical protein